MHTKLTVIVDNTADCGLEGEWGLSILAEIGGRKILVDTGKSELFADNLKALGFDMAAVDYGVLSHAHYDHANGMPRFFKDNQSAKFYLRDGAAENCYKRWKVILKKYIGLPKNVTSEYADRIEYVSGDYRLCEGAWLVPHKTEGLELIGKREKMLIKTARGWKTDSFAHEQSLVLDTDKGLVIVNSCSHGGVMNIVREVQETFLDKHIYGYIGGMHLFNKSDEFVRDVASGLEAAGVDFVCTGHCTMGHAYKVMKEILGDKLCQLKVGLVMEF